MKKIFCYLSFLCTLVFSCILHAQTITVTVTAPAFNPAVLSNMFDNPSLPTASLGQGDSPSFIAEKLVEAEVHKSATKRKKATTKAECELDNLNFTKYVKGLEALAFRAATVIVQCYISFCSCGVSCWY